eukprot:4057837-Pleurochrysis_carterae.AAC.2
MLSPVQATRIPPKMKRNRAMPSAFCDQLFGAISLRMPLWSPNKCKDNNTCRKIGINANQSAIVRRDQFSHPHGEDYKNENCMAQDKNQWSMLKPAKTPPIPAKASVLLPLLIYGDWAYDNCDDAQQQYDGPQDLHC